MMKDIMSHGLLQLNEKSRLRGDNLQGSIANPSSSSFVHWWMNPAAKARKKHVLPTTTAALAKNLMPKAMKKKEALFTGQPVRNSKA
uniref:Uncharacterized protein n=1 Tax=Acrobeloides nanus TaxID=290746 RepID=A0A914EBH8_9BILA